MRTLACVLALVAGAVAGSSWSAEAVSMPVPGAVDAQGRKVLTFIAKDPPGQRCNGNLQVAAEIANAYRVPIQLLPSSLAPAMPAPAVFYGRQPIVSDGGNMNGQASYQVVADVLEVEGVAKQPRAGLLQSSPDVRREFDALKASIKGGPR
jgi:hypothetical protein